MNWHVGRSFHGHRLEDVDPECMQHPTERRKTMRQGHREDACPVQKDSV